jgi:HEAT repeat protein
MVARRQRLAGENTMRMTPIVGWLMCFATALPALAQTPPRKADELLREIRSGDAKKALDACSYAVTQYPTPREYAPVFREALNISAVEIRCLAAAALWELEPAQRDAMIAVLKPEFRKHDGRYGGPVVRSLARLGPAAKVLLPEVLAHLQRSDQPYEWEHYVFPTLARMGPDVVTDMLPLLADGYRGPYLYQVILPLGPQAVPRMRPALADPSDEVRRRALEILKHFGPANRELRRELLKCLSDSSDTVRHAALEVVAEMGDEALDAQSARKERVSFLPRLQTLTADSKHPLLIRYRAADVLGALGPAAKEALPELAVALDGPPLLRFRAALAIEQIQPGNREAATVLFDLLKNPATPVEKRWHFARADLLATGSAPTTPVRPQPPDDPGQVHLTSMLWELERTTLPTERVLSILFERWQSLSTESLSNATERWNLAHGIMTYYGHRRAMLPILYRWCDAREPELRRMAVTHLCQHAEAVGEVLPVLAEELRGQRLERWQQVWSDLRKLGPLAQPLARPLFKLWTEAPDDERRALIAEILLPLKGPHQQPVRDWMLREFRARTSRSYWQIFELLVRHDAANPELLRQVREHIQSGQPWVVADWCATLGQIGPAAKAATPELRAALKAPYTICRVRAAAALWKIEARAEEVVPVLMAALAEGPSLESAGLFRAPRRDFALPAIQTLAEIGPPAKRAIAVIRQQMDYGDVALRGGARAALRAIDPAG